jgi:UDP:flavonoid glycosyltransferase YjiC (YdhE family)
MIVLVPNGGFLSETSRMLAIARALEARGERTSIASHGGPYTHLLDEAGVTSTKLDPPMDAAAANAFLDGLLSMGTENRRPFFSDDYIRAAVRAEAEHFKAMGAKLVVTGFNLTSYLSSRVANIPLAVSHGGSFVPPVLDRGLLPMPVNPPRPMPKWMPAFVARKLVHTIPYLVKTPLAGLNRVADELGVEHVPSLMALMCGDLTLLTELPEVLGISRDDLEAWRPHGNRLWPSTRMRYAGPLFAKLERPIPERVERFLAAPGKVVYVAPTSVQAPFLRTLVPAVRAAGARVLVASTIHDVRELETEGVLVEGVLPSHLVMPRVAAAVIMGGQGSVQTAMASGTPFVGMPFHGEQELNVALAERQGMALRLSPKVAGTPAMTAAIRRLLDEPAFRTSAAKLQQLYAGVDGAAAAADAILAYQRGRG